MKRGKKDQFKIRNDINTFDHYVGYISSRSSSVRCITNVHDVYLVTNIENSFCLEI